MATVILAGFVFRADILGRRQDEVWERIQREKVLRVGLDPSFPPFEVDTGGEIVGYDVDLAHALAQRWGARVQLVPTHFDGLIEGLLAGQYDVIISAFPYDPRLTQDVAYTQPYFNAGVVLVVRNDEQGVTGTDELVGRRVAVEWGSAGDVEARRIARQVPDLELLPLETAEAALLAIAAGRADAALVDAVSAYGFIAQQGSLRVVGEPLTDERYVIVVHPESWRLLEEIDAALEEFRSTGLLERLQSTWFAHR
jgi:polar amino acid transport system substrate-binding protein